MKNKIAMKSVLVLVSIIIFVQTTITVTAAELNNSINMNSSISRIKNNLEIDNNKLIIVGDSRTYNMSKWVNPTVHTEFVAKNGEGYLWFVKEAVTKVNNMIKPGDSIIIWLGVNDYTSNDLGNDSWKAYSEKINSLVANEWAECKVYVASVGYIDRNKYKSFFGKDAKANVNDKNVKGIQEFNINLKAELSSNITWLETNRVIGIKSSDKDYIPDNIWISRENGLKDGIHYGKTKTQEVYNYFVNSTLFSNIK